MTMANNKTFFATSSTGVVRAARGADDLWTVEQTLTGHDTRCLASASSRPEVIYTGTIGSGVLRSDDAGATWSPSGLPGQDVTSLAVSPHDSDTVYAGTRPSRIYRSRNGGQTWDELTGFLDIRWRWLWRSPAEWPYTAYVQAIALSPADPDILLAGVEFGAVVRSDDGGATWSGHRRGALRDCHGMTFHTRHGGWVYEAGGTGAGVAVSSDAGRNWRQRRDGLDRHYGWAVAADTDEPNIVYASIASSPWKAHSDGEADAAIFRSRGGGPWQRLTGGLPEPLAYMPYALVPDPDLPGGLYAGLSNGDVWHTEDQGETWQQLPFNLRGIHRSMIVT
jgi:photosystem II stability/assembly factor-like uncharacterized protein